MTVECEKCRTRFHVADARIPAKGARVRCSRCHHRFHILPSSAPPKQPSTETQSSADEPVLGGEAAREEERLDNPEFIFDRPERGPARAEPADGGIEQQHLAEPPEPETPPPPAEERVVSSGGVTAQQLLDEGAPELPTGRFDITNSLGEHDSLIGNPDDAAASGARLVPTSEPIERAEPVELVPRGRPASADIAAIAAELGEDEDTSFADWDPLATPQSPSVAAASPAASAPRATRSVLDQIKPEPAPVVRPKRRALADAPSFDPEATHPIVVVLRVAAVVVGVALLVAAARLLWLQHDAAPASPQVVQAAGWIAADLETFLARNAEGERVVVVRGNLFPEGSAPPPKVEVRLLGPDGASLVEASRTWLERIDDAEVAPERLSLRLASAGGEIGANGQSVTGFTAVIPDPPPGVHRVEVSLRAREQSPAGTATADRPSEPEAAPSAAPVSEFASPGPGVAPPAPGSDDGFPAAPAPE